MRNAGAPAPRLFAFGLGYSAMRLAEQLLEAGGWRVAGTVRDPARAEALRARGVEAFVFSDAVEPDWGEALAGSTHILASAPPDDGGDPALRAAKIAMAHSVVSIQACVYLSTTGIYGDRSGAWVDESYEPRPTRQRSRRRVLAEAQWRAFGGRIGRPVAVLRLAGIYGPGRSPFQALRDGTA